MNRSCLFSSRVALVALGLALSLLVGYGVRASATTAPSSDAPRRVNVPFVAGEVDWAQTAIFWLGKNEQGVPSRNYADVRMAYTSQALEVRVTVVDYYLWYNESPDAGDDLTQYDAAAVYVDTGFDRAVAPQTDDYYFLIGARYWPNENTPAYHRQARGTGADWDTTWTEDWTDYTAMQWYCNPGPNGNDCGIDYGWFAILTIPWEALGRSGPPAEGTLWGLGVQLYDRDDQPPAGYVAPEPWPETLDEDNPATWAELHFGCADYTPPTAAVEGQAMIRAASTEDNTVEDAWMGGGGTCSSGHEGGSEINHGDEPELFVGTETAPTHFPCFNKSFLRFSLDAIPPNKAIISASLTLHVWGHAGETPDLAKPSWVHLFTIVDPWEEMTIHWNNAPMAQENVSATWVYPYSSPGSIQWPGDPYTWDATQAVAEAYAAGQPVNLALYGSDKDQHSSKYMTSSETGDWNVEGRPTLRVAWGESQAPPQTELHKQAQPAAVAQGGTVIYTLDWLGTGQPMTMTDALPGGLSAPGPIEVNEGSSGYDSAARRVVWTGTPAAGQPITLTFPVTVQIAGPLTLRNTAALTVGNQLAASATTTIIVDGFPLYLPLLLRP